MRLKSGSVELLVLLFLVCALNAAVINLKKGDACANTCSGKENIFKYEENKIYVYNFLSRHSIRNPNAKEETLQLELQGKAQISKISACDFGLLLSDVKLKETLKEKTAVSEEYAMMKTMLEKYPLRFGFDDGKVTGVCQDNMDAEFAVNIKRAILSSLQVSIDSLETPSYLTETDIAGECITEYIPRPEKPNFVVFTKKKSIAGCSKKNKYFTTFSGKVYDKPKESRNLALLDGDYKCEVRVKVSEGLKESICEESHIFKPFRSETEGSRVVINQELRFDSIKEGKISAKVPTTRSDLTMRHGDKKPMQMAQKVSKPQPIVQEICDAVKGRVQRIKISELFLNLIRSLTETTYEDIKSLDKFISESASCKEGNVKAKSIFLDAMTSVKTEAAFKYLIEDAKIYKLSKLGVAIFENPTSAMISILAKQLDDSVTYNSVSTIISSMIKSFCEQNPGCMLNPDIIKAMGIITKSLGADCSDKNSRQKILYSLRAIGNAGSHPNIPKLVETMKECVKLDSNEHDKKVFAIQALRQFPCDKDIDKFLWTVFDGVYGTHSAELRIESYLSLIRCPTRATFSDIIQKLEGEKCQQFGSFVWSHISNLMETADRFKVDERDMLQIFTKEMNSMEKRFNLDFRSYSKNIEKTYQTGSSAAKVDTNIIFSSNSPIPASVSVNTTIDIFGRSINLFEFGIRGKGIQDKLFGGLRTEAHANPHKDVVAMDQKMKKPADKFSVSMYAKFLGREIYYSPNIIDDVVSMMIKQSKTTSFERSLLLIDSTVSIGSISGFPVELQLESTASVDYNLMKNNPMSLMDFEVSSKINYGIQITGKLLVNAHCTKIGIQSKGLIARDLEFGGKLKVKNSPNGDVDDYQFELSKIPDNSKLFSISNELSLITKLNKIQLVQPYKTKLERCTGEGMMKVMGIKFCLTMKEAPKFSSYLPNFKADVTIEKFSGLKVQWKKESELNPVKRLKSFLVLVSFPGSEQDTFRLKVEKDLSKKRQMYELLLWQKMIYFKYEINDKKITGELKSGKTEATLSGLLQSKTFWSSEMNVDIKSDKDTGKLYFKHSFTKSGPEIIVKLTRDGDKAFNLYSKTTVTQTNHTMFKKFERFRHSTVLKYSGDNEMSFIVESSKGNRPPTELKSKIEIFWKTKTTRNFYVRQNFVWQNLTMDENSQLFGKVNGKKWMVNLDHEIEVKNKKLNVANAFEYFVSKDFYRTYNQPSLMYIKFKREDLSNKEVLLETSTEFGMDLSDMNAGKFLVESSLNYRQNTFSRKFKSALTWKLNKIQMYDINAELTYEKFLELYFNHRFTSTQTGTTALEMRIFNNSYSVKCDLNLPKNQVLYITWPGNVIRIDSDVEAKSLSPFDVVVNHKIEMNNEVVAIVVNSAKYDSVKKKLSLRSTSKSSKGDTMIDIDLERRLDYVWNKSRVFFDYFSTTTVKVPSLKLDKNVVIEQFLDIDLDGKIEIKKKTFGSKIIVSDLSAVEKKKFGYEIVVTKKSDTIPYIKFKSTILTGTSDNSLTIKVGNDGFSRLFGLKIDSGKKLVTEMLYKIVVKGKTANISVLSEVNSITNPDYNYYYKRNMLINWEKTYSVKFSGEVGRSKADENLVIYKGELGLENKGWNKMDINFNLNCPKTCLTLANVNYILSYDLQNKEPARYSATFKSIVKWQKAGSRTANYYDLRSGLDFDNIFKKLEFDLSLAKDSSVDKFLLVKVLGIYGNKFDLEGKYLDRFANFNMLVTKTNKNDVSTKIVAKTSNNLLKEITIAIENKMIEKTSSLMCEMALVSSDKNYTFTVSGLRKSDLNRQLDFVENIKWESNIPYIESGASMFGFLVQNKNFQCSLNLTYKKEKLIDMKIDTTDVRENLKIALETKIQKTFKFVTSYIRNSDGCQHELDLTYDKTYIRVPKLAFKYSTNGAVQSYEEEMLIQTSYVVLKELKITSNYNIDYNNILNSLKSYSKIILNGEEVMIKNVDMPKGIMFVKNSLVKYIKILDMKSYVFDAKFTIKSARNFMVDYKVMVDDKDYSKMKLEYFRKLEADAPKKVDGLGESLFYLNVDMKRPSCEGAMTLFVANDKKSASIKMKADMPVIKMKFDEVTMTFAADKKSEGLYAGIMKYKGAEYSFTYKTSPGLKRELEIKSKGKDSVPQEIRMSFDFTKDYLFKLSFDNYFILDLSLLSKAPKEHSGKIMFSYKGEEKINLLSKTMLTIPSNVKTISDFTMAVFGKYIGIDLKASLSGKILTNTVNLDSRLYHVHSDKISKGTKSYVSIKLDKQAESKSSCYLMVSLDRKFPEVMYEDAFEMKKNDVVQCHRSMKITMKSGSVFDIEGNFRFGNTALRSSAKNNKDMISTFTSYNKWGWGFEVNKDNYETSLIYLDGVMNGTLKTNVGYLVKVAMNPGKFDVWPVGKAYYVSIMDKNFNSNLEFKITRSAAMAVEISYEVTNVLEQRMLITIKLYNEIDNNKREQLLGLETNFERARGEITNMLFKATANVTGAADPMIVNTILKINKKTKSEMVLVFKATEGKAPYSLDLNYKGDYIIVGNAKLDTKKARFSHMMTVKDGPFKTELWDCSSQCTLKSEFDCYLIHSNKARQIKLAMIWTKKVNLLEFMWNKRKEQGFLFSSERKDKTDFVILSSPLRTVQIARTATMNKGVITSKLVVGIVRKADPTRPYNFTIELSTIGLIESEYSLDIRLNSNLLHKGLKLTITRQLRNKIGHLYSVNIMSSFDDELKPFFTLEGNLRQISTNSYGVNIHATNYEKFLNLSASIALTWEEISFEYKIIQQDSNNRDFIFRIIPFKKFLLTNKKDFKILFSRNDYQYGYSREIVLMLGNKGPNITAYTTLVKSPFKYNAEFSSGGRKLVVNFRPVGSKFIGDIYRKISGTKVQDLKLTMSMYPNSTMATNLYWNPKFIDTVKRLVREVMTPDNLKAIMVDAYQNSENRISTFSSNIKMKLVKNLNAQLSVEFVKGVANDIESIPTAFAISYDDDDWYMKTIMDKLRQTLKDRDVFKAFEKTKNSFKMSAESMSSSVYSWFVEAKWYGVIYDGIYSKLDSVSYDHVKTVINSAVSVGKWFYKCFQTSVTFIGNKLEKISEQAKSVSVVATRIREGFLSNFKGSTIGKMIELLMEVRNTMLEGLGQVVETEFVKQRLIYYNTTISNIKDFVLMSKEMTKNMMQYIKSSSMIANVMETVKLIKSMKYKEAFLNMIKPEETKFEMDLDKGTMDLRFYVPPMIRPVYKMWKTASDWFPVQIMSQMRGSGVGGKLLSLFYRYEYLVFNYGSLKSLRNLLPPFKKTAWVMNGDSILTYDGNSVRIGSGKCSYLLARDTTIGSFSLLMHIKAGGEPKEFELSYIKKISILSSGMVKVDGVLLDTLPQLITDKKTDKSVEISRDYDLTKIVTSDGLTIKYFNNLDNLKVTFIGKWHGKVKGLLGSNDFEMDNDLSTPAGEITGDAGKLSTSWSVGECKSNTKTGLYSVRVDPKSLQGCAKLFKPDSLSYLSRCFSLINPEPYYELCRISLQYREMKNEDFEAMVCNLSRNYVVRCKTKGILLRLKKSCVSCGKDKLAKETTKLLMKKDIKFNYIFIIEQTQCLKPYRNLLKNLLRILSEETKHTYTLLAFNGLKIFKDSHFKLIKNEVSVQSKDFEKLLRTLESSEHWSKSNSSDISTEGSQAIFDAIKMPSKPGYVEKIVFFGCSACGEHKKHIFSTLAGLLKYSGISMTYLTAQPFTGSGSNSDIAGLKGNTVFYFDKEILSTKQWARDIQAPSDDCSNLAQLQLGTVWTLKSMTTEMRQRRVSEPLSAELLKVKGVPTQKCSCGTGNYEEGRMDCKVTGLI